MKKAVVFDMDGVIIDSEPIYQEQARMFFRKHDVPVEKEFFYQTIGISSRKYMEFLCSAWKEPISAQDLQSLMDQEETKPVDYKKILNPGVVELLQYLQEHSYKIALASSSPMDNILDVLKQCEITAYFQEIVSGDMFRESKPDPEIYRYTAEKLFCTPRQCVAIEDSPHGITAGLAAGYTVIAKREERYPFDQSNADYIIDQISDAAEIIQKL